jgi:lipase (class 3)
MSFTDEQVMLTLAGLTYRGFQDALSGEPHADVVCREVLDGLHTLSPIRNSWELVWGPVTGRGPRAVFDSSAMYVARHLTDRHRYVVAIRGTNPISPEDWLIGDLWVRATVPWPYVTADDTAAISASTTIGVATLQQMRSRGVPAPAPPAATSPAHNAPALPIKQIADTWQRLITVPLHMVVDRVQPAQTGVRGRGVNLRPQLPATIRPHDNLDLLSFLKNEADAATEPLEVVVTGHSKGGALAPTVALWLKEALASGDPAECWDTSRSARVSCHAFAGPTPGNAAFASRLDAVLGPDHHHLRNMNDVVTHAWQDDELRQIAELYNSRSARLAPLLAFIARDVRPLDYRQAQMGVRAFAGKLDFDRSFGTEFVHQHMDAYLEELELVGEGIHAVTFFV